LPAPEASGNPLGYKFSWSPQGVLNAASNSGKYRKDSEIVTVEGADLLKSAVNVPIMKGFAIEGYPNRDSLKYISLYNLNPAKLRTMFRGTLRYQGFSSLMDALKEIGLLSHLPLPDGKSASWVILLHDLIIESFAWHFVERRGRHQK
jgi:alpha-aminoadipic semialdehyde synthase